MGKTKHIVLATALVLGGTSLASPILTSVQAAPSLPKEGTGKVEEPSNGYGFEAYFMVEEQVTKALLGVKPSVDLSAIQKKYNLSNSNLLSHIYESIDISKRELGVFYLKDVGFNKGKVTFKYTDSKAKIKTMKTKYNKKIDSFLNGIIIPNMTDIEKVRAIHNTFINKTKKFTIQPVKYSTEYEALMEGKADAEGYAIALNTLLNRAGVTSYVIEGKGSTTKAPVDFRTWNVVKVEKTFYHLDAFADDTDSKTAFNEEKLTNFLVSTKTIKKDRTYNQSYLAVRGVTPSPSKDAVPFANSKKALLFNGKAFYIENKVLYEATLNGKEKKVVNKYARNLGYSKKGLTYESADGAIGYVITPVITKM